MFRSLGPETPNASIEIEIEPGEFLELQRAWERQERPEASNIVLLKTKKGELLADLLLRLDLIAYIRVISR